MKEGTTMNIPKQAKADALAEVVSQAIQVTGIYPGSFSEELAVALAAYHDAGPWPAHLLTVSLSDRSASEVGDIPGVGPITYATAEESIAARLLVDDDFRRDVARFVAERMEWGDVDK